VKTTIDRHILSAVQIFDETLVSGVDIRAGSLERRR